MAAVDSSTERTPELANLTRAELEMLHTGMHTVLSSRSGYGGGCGRAPEGAQQLHDKVRRDLDAAPYPNPPGL